MSYSQKTPFAQSLTRFTQNKIADNVQLLGQTWPCVVTAVNGPIVTVNFEVTSPPGITLPSVTCPIAESTYVQLPVQVGDYGIVVPASVRLGGITGLGLGLADLVLPANLGALVYVPIGNTTWESPNENAVYINGPDGVVLQDTDGDCVITLIPTSVTTTVGDTTVVINGTEVTINISGMSVTVDGTTLTASVGSSEIEMTATEVNITATTINLNGTIGLNGNITQNTSPDIVFTGTVTASDVLTTGGVDLGTHTHGGVTTGSGDTGPPL